LYLYYFGAFLFILLVSLLLFEVSVLRVFTAVSELQAFYYAIVSVRLYTNIDVALPE